MMRQFRICAAFMCILLFPILPTSSVGPTIYSKFFPNSDEDPFLLSAERRTNLKRIFNYIRNSAEFHPLILSVITSKHQVNMIEFISKYAAKHFINTYKVKANDLSWKCTWKVRTDLTWIIPVNNIHELKALIYWQPDLWKSTNQHLILLTSDGGKISWRIIFEGLWKKYNVYRVAVATVQDDFQCLTKYLPFDLSRDKFGKLHKMCFVKDKTSDTVLFPDESNMDATKNITTISFVKTDETFFESFRDFKNYPMDIVVFPSLMMNVSYNDHGEPSFSLLDGDVLTVLERALKVKFRVKVLTAETGGDPFHRSLKHIEDGNAEMALTGFFIKEYEEYNRYEFTSGVYQDMLCFIAPSAGLVPRSEMIFMPFRGDLWILLMIYSIVITVLWYFVQYLSRSFRCGQRIILPLMPESDLIEPRKTINKTPTKLDLVLEDFRVPSTTIRSMQVTNLRSLSFNGRSISTTEMNKNKSVSAIVSVPPDINPYVLSCFDLIETSCYPLRGGDTSAERAFLFGTLFFGLIVTGVYQSCLVSSLSKPFHYPELNTFEDVLNSNLTIATKYWNLKSTLMKDPELGQILKDKIEVITSSMPTNHLVAYSRNIIALGRYSSVKLENMTNYYDKEGNKLLHIAEECPAVYMVSYVVRQYSPYTERISTVLMRMCDAGLVGLWYRNMILPLEVEEEKRKVVQSERRIKLTLEHYSLAFLGLFFGLFMSTLVFLGEMYFAGRLLCQAESNA